MAWLCLDKLQLSQDKEIRRLASVANNYALEPLRAAAMVQETHSGNRHHHYDGEAQDRYTARGAYGRRRRRGHPAQRTP